MLLRPYRLADGTQVLLRPIRADDKHRLDEAFHRLSPESQRLRFLAPKPRLTTADLRYLTEIDGGDHVAVVAVLAHRPHIIVGVGRFVRDAADPRGAEVAIVIGDPWQRQGLGRHMGDELADLAREHGIERFTAEMLPDNLAAHRLFRRVSERLGVAKLAA
jgi:RimJ/RimL family protein N-acetyltransferase